MARLPTVGDDSNGWGSVLNTFLQVAHNADGTLRVSGGAGTQGAVPYIGASGALSQDATHLFYDATNHRLGIGNAAPNSELDVTGSIRTSFGLITPGILPASDSTTAVRILKSDAVTPIVTIDTTNSRVGIGTTPAAQLHTTGTVRHAANGLGLAQFDASGNLTNLANSLSAWTTYTPTITALSGTFTTVSGAGRYLQIGKLLFLEITVTITTNGTAAALISATLPSSLTAAATFSLSGREMSVTGNGLIGFLSSGSGAVLIQKYDGTYPGGSGFTPVVSGVIEVS